MYGTVAASRPGDANEPLICTGFPLAEQRIGPYPLINPIISETPTVMSFLAAQ